MLGAVLGDRRCGFRVWAPQAREVCLQLEGPRTGSADLRRDAQGFWSAELEGVEAGQLYRYRIDGRLLPDPCSRFQPDGPHGPSQVVDRGAHVWRDAGWKGIQLQGLVLYELHVGTFTQEGTLHAAAARLDHLQRLGVNAVELMPLAECPGRFNWGYDGVGWFAPSHNYGDHDALKAFVDEAHARGIGVILDVVYNHFGPDGNYLRDYSAQYFSSRATEWGDAINYDGPGSTPVRELVTANAAEWISEFHLDGLRLDATQSIFDTSTPHLLVELVQAARQAAPGRHILIIAENEPQRASHLLPAAEGGMGIDAMWNDDFHHSAIVAATGRREAYYHDYHGLAQEFVSTAVRGFLYQGQYYPWQKQARGERLRGHPSQCVAFLENHDQVANSLRGLRLHQQCAPGMHRALTALLLLGPQTPLLFMGQEFNSQQPFLFFADHGGELGALVRDGRAGFLSQVPGCASPDGRPLLADPGDATTFTQSKLDWSQCSAQSPAFRLHCDLLRLRREDPVLRGQGLDGFDGAVLGARALVLRWFDDAQGDRLLLVNLGDDIRDRPLPEPLLAPPRGGGWQLAWSSDDARYGGNGTVEPHPQEGWLIPGQSALLMVATRA